MTVQRTHDVGRLLISLQRLRPRDPASQAAVLRLLGFPAQDATATPGPGTPGPRRPELPPTVEPGPPMPAPEGVLARDQGRSVGPAFPGLTPSSHISRAVPSRLLVRARLQAAGPSQPESPPGEEPFQSSGDTARPHLPLFRPEWQRRLILATVSTQTQRRQVDVRGLTQRLALIRPVTTIPRIRSAQPGSGVQLILDLAETMTPFVRDQQWLIDALQRAVGSERVQVLRCDGPPLERVGAGLRDSWGPYVAPPPGWHVLVATASVNRNAGPTASSGWASFFQLVIGLHVPVTVLSPWGGDRSPVLPSGVPLVAWDRATTVGDVLRLTRTARR